MKPESVEKCLNFLDNFMMYLFSLVGVLASKYVPLLVGNGDIVIEITWGKFVISCVVAFIVLTAQEQGGDQKGKRKRFMWRAANAVAWGVAFHRFIGG